MDGTLYSKPAFRTMSGVAVDSELVKTREDAFSIERGRGFFAVSVFILDTHRLAGRPDLYSNLNRTIGFNRHWERPALAIQLVVEDNGAITLDFVEEVDFFLDVTYDRPVSPGEKLTSKLKILAALTSALSGEAYEDVLNKPHLGLQHLLTCTNAALARHLNRCQRALVYLNCRPGRDRCVPFFSPYPYGHSVLDLSHYARFTSPLRRYDDAANFAVLKAWLEGAPDPFTHEELQVVAHRCATQRGKKEDHSRFMPANHLPAASTFSMG